MFSFDHPTCQLEHTSNPGGLKLTTNSSIKLSSSHDIFSSDLSPSRQLSSLVSAGVWINRGNGLVFSFSFDTEGTSISSSDRMNLVETLGVLLRDAELWSQLGLKAALIFPTNCIMSSKKQPDLLLKLSHLDCQQGSVQSSKAGGESLATRDTNPPSGVLVAHLGEVAITWIFSLAPASALVRKREIIQSSSRLEDETFYDTAGDRDDMILLDDVLYHRCQHQKIPRCQASEPAATDTLEFEDNFILDTDYSSQESSVSSNFSRGFHSNGSPSSSCMLLHEDSSVSQESVLDDKVVFGNWAKLVDLSFRSLIYSDKRALRGIAHAQGPIEPKLAEISPALFSPGYLPAVAHRNTYIPTIARSITAVYNRSKSSILKIEVQQMTNLSLEERLQMLHDESDFETDIHPDAVMTPAVKLRLWQICQRILFDPSAARRLSPLELNTERSIADNCISQVMLDEEDQPCSDDRVPTMMERANLVKKSVFQDSSDQVDSLQDFSQDTLFEGLESHDHHILFFDACGFEDDLFCDSLIQDNDLHLPDTILDELGDDELYDSLFTADTSTFDDDDLHASERIDEMADDPQPSLGNVIHDDQSCLFDGHMSDAEFEFTPHQNYEIEDKNMTDSEIGESHDLSDIKSEASDQMLEDYEAEDAGLHARYSEETLLSD